MATTSTPDRSLVAHLVAGTAFAGSVLAVTLIGGAITQGTVDSDWFRDLEKPPWYPPPATFGIVWTPLYVLIAIAGYLAWRSGIRRAGLVAWGVQLALNLGWTFTFFGLRRPGWALVEILVLLAAILVTCVEFRRADRRAALLLLPYLAWVGFAAALTTAIAVLD